MTKDFAKLGIIAALIVAFCGWGALGAVISGVWETIVAFWPIIQGCIEYVIEDYFTSPYFITGVIMAIASAFGIWFGVRGGKVLYVVVSIVGALISLASLGVNFI